MTKNCSGFLLQLIMTFEIHLEKCKKESETWNSIGEQFKDSKHIQIAKVTF